MTARDGAPFLLGLVVGVTLGMAASLTLKMAVDMATARTPERSWWPSDYMEEKR